MKKIEVKPYRRRSTDDTVGKNAMSKIRTAAKIREKKTNSKTTKVDKFAVKVIDDMYNSNTDLFTKSEVNVDLNKKDEKMTQDEVDQDIKKLWREFMEDTTMHGLKHVNQQQQYRLRR